MVWLKETPDKENDMEFVNTQQPTTMFMLTYVKIGTNKKWKTGEKKYFVNCNYLWLLHIDNHEWSR